MQTSLDKLSEIQLSALSEAGNIGSGHAAIALSQLIGRKIMVAVTSVKVMKADEFPDFVGDANELVAGVYLKVLGDAQGSILLVLHRDSAGNLVDVLMNQKIGSTKILGEMEQSCLKETGSILSASYLNSLSDLMKITLIPSVPRMTFDRLKTVFKSVFEELQRKSDVLVGIETEFVEAEVRVRGYFLFMPDLTGLDVLMKALGV